MAAHQHGLALELLLRHDAPLLLLAAATAVGDHAAVIISLPSHSLSAPHPWQACDQNMRHGMHAHVCTHVLRRIVRHAISPGSLQELPRHLPHHTTRRHAPQAVWHTGPAHLAAVVPCMCTQWLGPKPRPLTLTHTRHHPRPAPILPGLWPSLPCPAHLAHELRRQRPLSRYLLPALQGDATGQGVREVLFEVMVGGVGVGVMAAGPGSVQPRRPCGKRCA